MKHDLDDRGDGYKYWAFISYSHKDKAWGDWLHKRLETYTVPGKLRGRQTAAGTVPRKLYPIFRDREELPSSADLSRNIDEAIKVSRSMVVICSPHAAASAWVNEEIRQFKQMGRADRIMCLIVGGEPNATDKGLPEEECFPPSIRHVVDAAGALTEARAEPIAADVRPGMDGKTCAKLKLLAGILGIEYAQLNDRELRRRWARTAVLSLLAFVLLGAFTGLWWHQERGKRIALTIERDEAKHQFGQALLERAQRFKSEGREMDAFLTGAYALGFEGQAAPPEARGTYLKKGSRAAALDRGVVLNTGFRFAGRTPGFTRHLDVAVSPDGARIYSADGGDRVRCWDAASGALLRSFEMQGRVEQVAINPEGTSLAVLVSRDMGPDSFSVLYRLALDAKDAAPVEIGRPDRSPSSMAMADTEVLCLEFLDSFTLVDIFGKRPPIKVKGRHPVIAGDEKRIYCLGKKSDDSDFLCACAPATGEIVQWFEKIDLPYELIDVWGGKALLRKGENGRNDWYEIWDFGTETLLGKLPDATRPLKFLGQERLLARLGCRLAIVNFKGEVVEDNLHRENEKENQDSRIFLSARRDILAAASPPMLRNLAVPTPKAGRSQTPHQGAIRKLLPDEPGLFCSASADAAVVWEDGKPIQTIASPQKKVLGIAEGEILLLDDDGSVMVQNVNDDQARLLSNKIPEFHLVDGFATHDVAVLLWQADSYQSEIQEKITVHDANDGRVLASYAEKDGDWLDRLVPVPDGDGFLLIRFSSLMFYPFKQGKPRNMAAWDQETELFESVALSEDGTRYAYVREIRNADQHISDHYIPVSATKTGEVVNRLQGLKSAAAAIALDASGARLAGVDGEGTCIIWDVASGKPLQRLTVSPQATAMAFDEDDAGLLIGYADGSVERWDTGRDLFHKHAELVGTPGFTRFSPADDVAYIATGAQYLLRWDTRTDGMETIPDIGHTYNDGEFTFLGAGILLSTRIGDFAVLYDMNTGSRREIGVEALGDRVAAAPGGRQTAFLCYPEMNGQFTHVIKIADMDALKEIATISLGEKTSVGYLAYSHDGRTLAVGVEDAVLLYETGNFTPTGQLTGHAGAVGGIAFSPDDARIYTWAKDDTVRAWDAKSQRPLHTFDAPGARALALAPQGDSLVIAAKEGLTFWNPLTFEPLGLIPDPDISENGIDFNRNGDKLVEAYDDYTMRMRRIHRQAIATEYFKEIRFEGLDVIHKREPENFYTQPGIPFAQLPQTR
jgi:WD40 repeat protein